MSGGLALVPQSYYYEFLQRGLNVKDFGATGNGTSDDTEAIQAALTAAGTSPFGVVLMPPGTYLVSSTLTMGGGVRLIGSGMYATTIQLANGANCNVIQTPNDGTLREGAEIINLAINGNASNQTGGDAVIEIYACSYFTLAHCYIFDPYNHGVHIGAQPSGGQISVMPRIYNSMIYGAQNVSKGHGLFLDGYSSDGMVHDNDIGWFSDGSGYYLSQHNGSYLANNNAWQCNEGYHLYEVQRIRMDSCLSDLANQTGFNLQSSEHVYLTGCQAKDSNQSNGGYDGFLIEGVSGNISQYVSLSNCSAFFTLTQGSGGLSIPSYVNYAAATGCDFANTSGAVYVGTSAVTNLNIVSCQGYNPQGWKVTAPALPAAASLTDAVQNTTGSSVRIYQTGQAGTHIVDKWGNDKELPVESAEITLDAGCKIYYATTVPISWSWYGI